MKTLQIYDPAMCCSSGVCGPDVDTKLVQLAGFLKSLEGTGVEVERYNLSQEPAAYAANETVAAALKKNGVGALPLVLLDGETISSGEYPDLDNLADRLGIDTPQDSSCCSGSGCC